MRSFLSLSFFRPAKAILVPGMYYHQMSVGQYQSSPYAYLFGVFEILEKCGLVPSHALVDICGGVRETFDLTGFTTKEAEPDTR
jgi:hypothetical protein